MPASKSIAGYLTLVAAGLMTFVVIIIPLGNFYIHYEDAMARLEIEVEINARLVRGIISRNPEMWEFQRLRIEEYLTQRPGRGEKEIRRVLNNQNEVVAESADELETPLMMYAKMLTDAGIVVGKLEIYRSVRPLLVKTGLVALFMTPLGFGMYLLIRHLPIRAIHQAEQALRRSEDDLRRSSDLLEVKVQKRTRELAVAKEAAESSSRTKSEFLANMSHELRTPLNHIIGFTELVANKQCGGLNPEQEEYLNDVLDSSRHLLSLINDILDLSKVEAGKLELQLSQVPPRILFNNGLAMFKEKALKRRIKLSADINGIPETIPADERKLKQIIYNLLANAVKFTPDGGRVCLGARKLMSSEMEVGSRERQRIYTELRTQHSELKGEFIEISVQDTGIGIKEKDLERIFTPFEQGDNSASRHYQGTGLGLSLTRRLVELHGGKIWAESEGEGRGSKFVFVIPE
jgi:signal transduction histidine kinase